MSRTHLLALTLIGASLVACGTNTGPAADLPAPTAGLTTVPLAVQALPATANFTTTVVSGVDSKCMDVPGSSTVTFTKYQLFACNSTAAQSYTFKAVAGQTGTYTVVNVGNGLCVSHVGRGTAVYQDTCSSSTLQFSLVPVNAAAKSYQLKSSIGCLSGYDNATVAGSSNTATGLSIAACAAAPDASQTFILSGKP